MKKTYILLLLIVAIMTTLFLYSCKNADDNTKTPGEQEQKQEEILLNQDSVADFAINENGVVSFTEERDVTYTLYLDDVSYGKIKSGDNIRNLVSSDSCLCIVKDAREGYNASPKSNVVKVFVNSNFQIELDGFNLKFNDSLNTYYLGVVGRDIGDIVAENQLNIKDYINCGSNELYVYAKNGRVEQDKTYLSDRGLSISVYLHEKINVGIGADGIVSLDENLGFIYEYDSDGTPKMLVKNGDDIQDALNSLNDGDNTITFYVREDSSVTGGYYLVGSENETKTVNVNKYKVPSNIAVTNTGRIIYDSESSYVKLFINNVFKSNVNYGDNIYKWLGDKTSSVKLMSGSDDNGWQSNMSEEIIKNFPSYIEASTLKIDEEYFEHYLNEEGVTVVGKEGTSFSCGDSISLTEASNEDCLLNIVPVWKNNSFGFEKVTIKFQDAYDSTKGVKIVFVNGLKNGLGSATYILASKLEEDYSGVDFGDYTPATNSAVCFASDTANIKIKFNIEENKFYLQLDEITYTWWCGVKNATDLTDAFSDGNNNLDVKVSVEYSNGDGVSGFIVKRIGEIDFTVSKGDSVYIDNDAKYIWENLL